MDAVTRIVMIDDSEVDRYIYRRYLEQNGSHYEVHEAWDRQSGIRLVEQLNPACILLDLNLSGAESGYDVLRELLGEEPPYKRTVIVLTVLALDCLKEGALSFGAAAFLVKGKTDAAGLDLAIRQAIGKTSMVG